MSRWHLPTQKIHSPLRRVRKWKVWNVSQVWGFYGLILLFRHRCTMVHANKDTKKNRHLQERCRFFIKNPKFAIFSETCCFAMSRLPLRLHKKQLIQPLKLRLYRWIISTSALESTISLTYICSRFWIFDKKGANFYTQKPKMWFFCIFWPFWGVFELIWLVFDTCNTRKSTILRMLSIWLSNKIAIIQTTPRNNVKKY